MILHTCTCCGNIDEIASDEVVPGYETLDNFGKQVIDMLLLRPGRFVKRSTMIDYLWGDDPNGGPDNADAVLRQHVLRIRNKLGVNSIETSWGYGYRLNVKDIVINGGKRNRASILPNEVGSNANEST